jgi:hypothetical protein
MCGVVQIVTDYLHTKKARRGWPGAGAGAGAAVCSSPVFLVLQMGTDRVCYSCTE